MTSRILWQLLRGAAITCAIVTVLALIQAQVLAAIGASNRPVARVIYTSLVFVVMAQVMRLTMREPLAAWQNARRSR